MEPKTLLLDNDRYQDYLSGKEVECEPTQFKDKEVMPGQHIMVYKDTLSTITEAAGPTREKQSEYIGVEGTVTRVNVLRTPSESNSDKLQSIIVKKL